MVLVSETVNLVWLGVGTVVAVSGYAIYKFSWETFYIMVVGLPLFLIGVSVVIFKIYELFQTLAPSRIKLICSFCKK